MVVLPLIGLCGAGVLTAWLFRRRRGRRGVRRFRRGARRGVAAALALLLLLAAAPAVFLRLAGPERGVQFPFMMAALLFAGGLLVLALGW
ncbi:MAG TPA: hypothetical protein VKV26_06150 [Dehalococcoidia bacterium]|nr:hypothetical protein [Dehalococcoidia bacterium]